MTLTAVLIPTIHRPAGLRRSLQTLKETCDLSAIVAADPDDAEAESISNEFGATLARCEKPRQGAANAWNQALRAAPDYDAYFLGSDDIVFTPGWYEAALRELDKLGGDGLVGVNDGRWDEKKVRRLCATHYLMTRQFIIQHNGGVAACPHYRCDWTDMESNERARRVGQWAWAEDALVRHDWRGPNGDDGYRRASAFRNESRLIYLNRKERGFPDDFEPILK